MAQFVPHGLRTGAVVATFETVPAILLQAGEQPRFYFLRKGRVESASRSAMEFSLRSDARKR